MRPPIPARRSNAKRSKESEKKAKEQQPGSYKEEETADKVVEIPPTGPDERPIRGSTRTPSRPAAGRSSGQRLAVFAVRPKDCRLTAPYTALLAWAFLSLLPDGARP